MSGVGLMCQPPSEGCRNVIQKQKHASTFACPDDVWRRHAKESGLNSSCRWDNTNRDQSRRYDSFWARSADLEGGSDILRAVLRHHVGRDYGKTSTVAPRHRNALAHNRRGCRAGPRPRIWAEFDAIDPAASGWLLLICVIANFTVRP